MKRVWLFDLDDTLHDASSASLPGLHRSFGEYIQQHLGLTKEESDALRRRYWLRYGATLLGLVKHHAVDAAHFLHHTHLLPGLEQVVRSHAADVAVLRRLRGRKFILTNAPRASVDVYNNGDASHPPKPGDMLVWTNSTYGHVALIIVRSQMCWPSWTATSKPLSTSVL